MKPQLMAEAMGCFCEVEQSARAICKNLAQLRLLGGQLPPSLLDKVQTMSALIYADQAYQEDVYHDGRETWVVPKTGNGTLSFGLEEREIIELADSVSNSSKDS